MISIFKKIWNFAGKEKCNIKKSIIVGFFYAIFYALQLYAIFAVLNDLIMGNTGAKTAWIALGIMFLSVIGKMITHYFQQLQRTHVGYFMVAQKRIQIGDKLKAVPMGYFNKNSLGNITAVSTTILSDVEMGAPIVLINTFGGLVNALVFAIAILLFDWRIGLIVISGMALYLVFVASMQNKTAKNAPLRQTAQENLIDAALETIQGMSVVKAFNLEKNKKIDCAMKESCKQNIRIEKAISPYLFLQNITLDLFSVGIMLLSIYFCLQDTLSLAYCLMMIVASFLIFGEMKTVSAGIIMLPIVETSIDRANQLDNVPIMADGKVPMSKNHEITFDHVSFAYQQKKVLDCISFQIPEKTMTAIVGPSGSGKSTICALMTRFWDVDSGIISIGGRNIKDYVLSDLMANISIVFQNVYLFADTIENNIKFGKPEATHEEVVQAAKRACCDDFISALPDGYNTVIGEGGASLSGGEKQRISIARAMLKDAPIVIFDEATANIDPENEDRLQMAIEELTRDKTIIMIAHRLKTVKNADQILVVDDGKIIQQGKHEKLIKEQGIYADFVLSRKETIGWKLNTDL